MDKYITRISFVGAGKVARQMVPWLHEKGVKIVEIFNRSPETAKSLADAVNAEFVSEAKALNPDVDMVIIAVSDDAIASISETIPQTSALVVHTSGSRNMNDLKKHDRRGVLYPLQSFSDVAPVDFRTVPLCIEAVHEEDESLLKMNSLSWGSNSYLLNSEQREIMHVAAVIANNFANHLWGLGFDFLKQHQIHPDILYPLILETVNKAMHSDPHAVQTGPAVRADERTIARHIEKLKDDENLLQIYRLITRSIQEKHGKL